MARTATGARLTEAHRRGQLQIRARALQDFIRIWPLWDGSARSFRRLTEASVPLARAHHRLSSTFGGSYYEAFRKAEGLSEKPPKLADFLDEKKVAGTLFVVGQKMTGDAIAAGHSPQAAMQTALTRTSGAMTRMVLEGGRESLVLSTAADQQAQGWVRVTSGDPCAFCAMLCGRGPVFSEDSADFEAHDHCVPAGTLVTGPSVERGFRRRYEGELIIIRLAGGDELAITPNHPVLTDRGWLDANLLCEGDDVAHRFGADLDALRVPHEHEVPAPIEDVWGAPGMGRLRSVPVAAEDFHGDGVGSQGNVDVVAPDGLLPNEADALPPQVDADALGSRAGRPTVARALARERDAALMLLGVAAAPSSCVGCRSLSAALLGGGSPEVRLGRGAGSPAGDPGLLEPPGDDAPRYAVASSL